MKLEVIQSIKRSLEEDAGKPYAFCNSGLQDLFNRAHFLLFPLPWERPAKAPTFFSLLEDIDSTLDVLKALEACVPAEHEIARQSRYDILNELRVAVCDKAVICVSPEFTELFELRKLLSSKELSTFMLISKTSRPTDDNCETMRRLSHQARETMRAGGELHEALDAWLEQKFDIYDGVLRAKGAYIAPLTALQPIAGVAAAAAGAGAAASAAGPSGLK